MPSYARLKELGFDTDDSELFEVGEVGMNFLDKLGDGDAVQDFSAEAERSQQQKTIRDHMYTVPSTALASQTFSELQISKGCPDSLTQKRQQKHQERQNSKNGNPNVCSPDPTTQPTVVAICSHNSTAGGTALQEQQPQVGGRRGASPSGRWVGRNVEERSGRWRPVGCESYHRDNASSVLEDDNIHSRAPSSSPTCGQWTPSLHRGTLYREPTLNHQSQEKISSAVGAQPQHPQPQEKQSCTLHSSCNDIRYCQRFSKESPPREGLFDAPIQGPEKRSLPSVKSDASYGGCFTQERGPTFQRSSSAREAPGLQRSGSTRDTSGHRYEMSIENWKDHPASRSAHVSDRTKHRVSFTLTENHELETQKLREKFREPTPPRKKVLQAKQHTANQQSFRSNYEQPDFVDREKENICGGKSYTMYGVKEVKDCPKGPSGRHHQFVRACSLRENGSDHAKMQRAYSVNAGRGHGIPMECDTCGKGGIGIVFLGLPGNEANFCKACKSSSGTEWCCGESKPPRKKKSIMDYCRKILRLPEKPR